MAEHRKFFGMPKDCEGKIERTARARFMLQNQKPLAVSVNLNYFSNYQTMLTLINITSVNLNYILCRIHINQLSVKLNAS